MDKTMQKWLDLSESMSESIENKDQNFVVLDHKKMEDAFLKSFEETIKLPQIQEILEVLSKQ